MKDYSLNRKDSESFILSYKIEDGNIVTKTASGELITVPYSVENENQILSKMEQQAKMAKLEPLSLIDRYFAIIQPIIILPLAIYNFIYYGGSYYAILLLTVGFTAIFFPAQVISHLLKKKELKKIRYFLSNKNELNECIEKCENKELGLSQGAVQQIEIQKKEKKSPITINNLDNYSLADLKRLKENIEKITSPECTDNISEEKGPVFEKKINS